MSDTVLSLESTRSLPAINAKKEDVINLVERCFDLAMTFLPLPMKLGAWAIKKVILNVIIPRLYSSRAILDGTGAAPDDFKNALRVIFAHVVDFFGPSVSSIATSLYDLFANQLVDMLYDKIVNPVPAPDVPVDPTTPSTPPLVVSPAPAEVVFRGFPAEKMVPVVQAFEGFSATA